MLRHLRHSAMHPCMCPACGFAPAALTSGIPLAGTSEARVVVLFAGATAGRTLPRAGTPRTAVTAPRATTAAVNMWRIIVDAPFIEAHLRRVRTTFLSQVG